MSVGQHIVKGISKYFSAKCQSFDSYHQCQLETRDIISPFFKVLNRENDKS
jgi:hypothetical protein